MKKILCMLTLITVCIIFVACQQTETTSCPTAVESTTPEESIEYTVYIQNEIMEEVVVESKVVDGTKFKNAASLNIFRKSATRGYVDENIPKFKTIEYLGKKYTGEYRFSEEFQFPKGMGYIYVDRYECKIDNVRYSFAFNRDTGRLEIINSSARNYPEELKTNFEEVIVKAKEYMKTVCGDDDLSDCIVDTSIYDRNGIRWITVVFEKTIAGKVIESDGVELKFDFEGNMVSAYTLGYGYMDDFYRKNITEKRVNAAEEKLLSMLPKDLYVQDDRYVCVDANTGICYLSVFSEEGELYININ